MFGVLCSMLESLINCVSKTFRCNLNIFSITFYFILIGNHQLTIAQRETYLFQRSKSNRQIVVRTWNEESEIEKEEVSNKTEKYNHTRLLWLIVC